MSSQEFIDMSQTRANFRANLEFGQGSIESHLRSEDEITSFGEALSSFNQPINHGDTADCIDGRGIIRLGDGTEDPNVLRLRVAWQLPGGLGLATTKAAVAADAAYLGNVRNFKEAYLITNKLLKEMKQFDGGHEHCGASAKVESSAANPVIREIALPTLGAIMEINESRSASFDKNSETKNRRLQDGFFGGWDSNWHEDFLHETVPQNFAYLTEDHVEDGIDIMTSDNIGFAKNAFREATGKEAFGYSVAKAVEISNMLGGTPEERERILMGFGADLLDVSDKLIAKGMPVFLETA